MRLTAMAGALVAAVLSLPNAAHAFCGFFVAKADASLFNEASQVVIVHDEGKTVLTMVNNYKGEPRAFALVVPVPVVLTKDMVRVTDMKVVDHLDAYSAPRLAEYFDPNPCARYEMEDRMAPMASAGRSRSAESAPRKKSAKSLGVTIEATYTVGEYDIVVLSAKQSDGLETYLRQEKYNIPKGASRSLAPYIRSGMKFFVAKVNLKKLAKGNFQTLRPLQFAYPDKRFMLPVRLGMINADGDQDLLAYVITRQARAEVANYRNPKLPSDMTIPTFIKQDFTRFYRDMFTNQVRQENGRAVFTEYAWNMGWCDPCAADPLSTDQLRKLGVWWVGGGGGKIAPNQRGRRAMPSGGPQQAFVTRLHARYNPQTFPEDLMLKVTKDSSNFQARYVLQHPWGGTDWCDAMGPYLDGVKQRREQEVQALARLTGWSTGDIWPKMLPLAKVKSPDPKQPDVDPGWLDNIKNMFKE